jgi:hypothetical protein
MINQTIKETLKMKSEYYVDMYDMDHAMIFKEVYIGKYKLKAWANHKI